LVRFCNTTAIKFHSIIYERKRQLGARPEIGFFLNRPFWRQKHHFKRKKRGYF